MLYVLGVATGGMHHHEDGEVHEDCPVCIFVTLSKSSAAPTSALAVIQAIAGSLQFHFKNNTPLSIVRFTCFARGPPLVYSSWINTKSNSSAKDIYNL